MIKKFMTGVLLGAGMLAMAMPAGAAKAPPQKTTSLTAWPNGTTVEGTADVSYNATTQRMIGSIHVDAGALPPGRYGYWLGLDNFETPYGLETSSELICTFTVGPRRHATGCHGSPKAPYGFGETNSAGVYSRVGGEPPLAGWFS
jgi:hypothetical protein